MRGPTALSDEVLRELAEQGRAAERRSRFVDPHAIYAVRRLIEQYGEVWAASVLRRDLSRRAQLEPGMPWLYAGDVQTLLLAEEAEFSAIVESW